MKQSIVLLAYGEMGPSAYSSLTKDFQITGVVVPPQENEKNTLAVEKLAKTHKVRIFYTNKNSEIEQIIRKMKARALVICSYNKILPSSLLYHIPCINVHHGDLPRFRGRANLNWAIINGRKSIGLTIHQAVPELDAGNIYAKYNVHISEKETISTLYEKINVLVLENLGKVVQKVLSGDKGQKQVGKPTYCCTRLPEDGLINWNDSSKTIDRFIRALTKPFPGAFTYFNGHKMIIWDAEIPTAPRTYEGRIPGRVILLHKNLGVEVLTGDSSLIIKKVAFENKEGLASEFIKTVKTSLGINWVRLYEKLSQ